MWTTNKRQETIGDVYCPTCRDVNCVYISTNENDYDFKKCKAGCHVLNILFKDQKSTITLFGGDGTHCFARKTSRDYEKENPSPFLRKLLRQSDPSASEPEPRKAEVIPFIKPPLHSHYIHFQSTLKQHGFLSLQWRYCVSLDFGPDSVTLTVQDLVQEKTISSQKIPLVAWSLLLSQRQQFLNNHLARDPVTPN